ncbi:MAG TPA: thioredoxin reductase [Methanosarcinales archaeon]|nr:thioredoxin reductase [Methanosarcinales archaeon]
MKQNNVLGLIAVPVFLAHGHPGNIYAARYNLKTILLTESIGGATATAYKIENYPGFPSISGMDLVNKFQEHVESQNVEILLEPVEKIEKLDNRFKVNNYEAISIILATGTNKRKLGVPGEKEFLGHGVSYCATCDGFFFKNLKVAIVGGGNNALYAALVLTDLAKKVYLIHRRKEFRGEPIALTQIKSKDNVEFVLDSIVEEIKGDKLVSSVVVKNVVTNETKDIKVDGVFIEIGTIPNTSLAAELGVKLDDAGYVVVDNSQRTSVEGVFAAGDITTNSNHFEQIVTAVAEGAIAAASAYEYIKSQSIV